MCLVVALVALAFAVVALVRARAAEERSAAAAAAAARAEANAHAAVAGLDQLETRLAQARQEAADAAQQAARAAQSAAAASASAIASRREAEAASDRAARAESAREQAEAGTLSNAPRVGTAGADAGGRATVWRAEDHEVAGGDSGATERIVQVAWQLEHVRGTIWALRNTGVARAHGALLSDATVPPKFVRPDEVIPRDVERDDALRFRVTAGRGGPPPRVRVTWREGAGSPAYSREFTVLAAS